MLHREVQPHFQLLTLK